MNAERKRGPTFGVWSKIRKILLTAEWVSVKQLRANMDFLVRPEHAVLAFDQEAKARGVSDEADINRKVFRGRERILQLVLAKAKRSGFILREGGKKYGRVKHSRLGRNFVGNVPVESIRLDDGQELPDVAECELLLRSIAKRSILVPLLVRPDLGLICGRRRLACAKSLGLTEVCVRCITTLEELEKRNEAREDENTVRYGGLPLPRRGLKEKLDTGRSIEPLIEEKMRANQKSGGSKGGKKTHGGQAEPDQAQQPAASDTGKVQVNLPEPCRPQSRDEIGAILGMSGSTYSHARHVEKKASQNEAVFGPIRDEMYKDGKIDAAYKKTRELEGKGPSKKSATPTSALKAFSRLATKYAHMEDEKVAAIVRCILSVTGTEAADAVH